MFKLILALTAVLFLMNCGAGSRTAKVVSKEDYEKTLQKQYPKSFKEDQAFNDGIAVLAKDIVKIMQRNQNNLYNVSVEEFISEREYGPGLSETSAFGRIIANRIANEIVQYADTLERKGSKVSITVDVIKRKAIKRFDFIQESDKRRVDGSVRIIISGSYHEMNPPIVAIEASVYSSQTALAQAASVIRVPVPHTLMWESTSDQYIWGLDHKRN